MREDAFVRGDERGQLFAPAQIVGRVGEYHVEAFAAFREPRYCAAHVGAETFYSVGRALNNGGVAFTVAFDEDDGGRALEPRRRRDAPAAREEVEKALPVYVAEYVEERQQDFAGRGPHFLQCHPSAAVDAKSITAERRAVYRRSSAARRKI